LFALTIVICLVTAQKYVNAYVMKITYYSKNE